MGHKAARREISFTEYNPNHLLLVLVLYPSLALLPGTTSICFSIKHPPWPRLSLNQTFKHLFSLYVSLSSLLVLFLEHWHVDCYCSVFVYLVSVLHLHYSLVCEWLRVSMQRSWPGSDLAWLGHSVLYFIFYSKFLPGEKSRQMQSAWLYIHVCICASKTCRFKIWCTDLGLLCFSDALQHFLLDA